jgi:phosphonate transport system ATP-binding protein
LASSVKAESVVRAEALGKIYPNGVAGLRELTLSVGRGELVGLLGRSGSGKTTLFRLLVGALRPTRGRLEVLGTDMGRARAAGLRKLRRRVAWISQHHNLVPSLSAAHNVLLSRLGHQRLWRTLSWLVWLPERERRAAFSVLAELGVAEKLYQRVDDLSGGQQQRVAVARALLGRPELVLADEPVASVDTRTAEDVLDALVRLNQSAGTTVVVSLHQPELALRYCPRIVVLAEGQLVYDGPPAGLPRSDLYALGDDAVGGGRRAEHESVAV